MNDKRFLKIFLTSTPVHIFSRLILGGIFIFSSLDKIIHPLEFAKILYNYKLLPNNLINITSAILPWGELLLGSILVMGIFPKQAAIMLSLLLVIFICAFLINIIRGIEFDCGCFSRKPSSSRFNAIFWILRDIIILIPGIIIIFFNKEGAQK